MPGSFKAFALTGRIADCHYTQGVALGCELLPFQGVLLGSFCSLPFPFSLQPVTVGLGRAVGELLPFTFSLRPVTVGSGRAVGELLPFTFPFGW